MNLELLTLDPTSPSGIRAPSGSYGWISECGYWRINVKGKKILCHRAVYCLTHGKALEDVPLVDHINRDRLDNRPENLRELTKAENNRNRAPARGVSFCKQTGKWKAGLDGKWLGRHDTEEEAARAVEKARE